MPKGHVLKDCKSNFFCRIEGCKKKHHTLLHEATQANSNVSNAKHNLRVTYLHVLQIYVSNCDVSVKVNGLLDCGSDSTLVTTRHLLINWNLKTNHKINPVKCCLILDQNNIKTCKFSHFFSIASIENTYLKYMSSRKPRFAEI